MYDYKKYQELVFKIIGASMEVHRELGWGLVEKIYEESLSIELSEMGIPNVTQCSLPTFYKGHKLTKVYEMDLVVDDVICELKSAQDIHPAHRAQLCNYLRLTRKPIGLIINFGTKRLQGERWALDPKNNDCFLLDKDMNRLDMTGIVVESGTHK